MFTIQYEAVNGETKMQDLDSNNRNRLIVHLATFPQPILNIFEQTTPITGAIRKEMATWQGTMSAAAAAFVSSLR